jgi:class 4 POU domain transcription factor
MFMDDGGLAPSSFTDLSKATLSSSHFMKPDFTYHHHPSSHHPDMSPHSSGQGMGVQLPLHGFAAPSDVMLDQLQMQGLTMPPLAALTPLGDYSGGHSQHPLHSSSLSSQAAAAAASAGMAPMYGQMYGSSPSISNLHHHPSSLPMMLGTHAAVAAAAVAGAMRGPGAGSGQPAPQRPPDEADYDPQELEAFAEHFKQRRIKLGSTQADVGKALGNLKLPGVGSLSQSTICRFESLTLSHNNMVALRPVLETWLDDAERAYRDSKFASDVAAQSAMMGGCGGGGGGAMAGSMAQSAADRKRKRTSIATPEKRSLEAYFSVQPRPSGEKIAQIADKLDLKKNVVRVWFCNQRQKQKRMKFATPPLGPGGKVMGGH